MANQAWSIIIIFDSVFRDANDWDLGLWKLLTAIVSIQLYDNWLEAGCKADSFTQAVLPTPYEIQRHLKRWKGVPNED